MVEYIHIWTGSDRLITKWSYNRNYNRLYYNRRDTKEVPLVEFTYLVFTCKLGESSHRRLRSLLLYLCYVFWAQINSLVGWFCTSTLGLILFQICWWWFWCKKRKKERKKDELLPEPGCILVAVHWYLSLTMTSTEACERCTCNCTWILCFFA